MRASHPLPRRRPEATAGRIARPSSASFVLRLLMIPPIPTTTALPIPDPAGSDEMPAPAACFPSPAGDRPLTSLKQDGYQNEDPTWATPRHMDGLTAGQGVSN
jgi:hypothetical protein